MVKFRRGPMLITMFLLVGVSPGQAGMPETPPLTMAEVLAAAPDGDWRAPEPEDTVYFELESGRVVMELAPAFAPGHVRNIRALVRAGYFDGAFIVRSQDNYVVQWGRAGEAPGGTGDAKPSLPGEYARPIEDDLPFTGLPDPDSYAPRTGFSLGFPVARDPAAGRTWLVHCYGMVGAGRDMGADSGSGAELYTVIGHSPRHLDRNVTLVGRVISGIELLSVLPRGTGPLGFYESEEAYVPIVAAKLAADVPEAQRTRIELLRTDSGSFAALIEARRTRREDWFIEPTGRIGVCNVPLPSRPAGP
jgi:peptidylprolyl isomerase